MLTRTFLFERSQYKHPRSPAKFLVIGVLFINVLSFSCSHQSLCGDLVRAIAVSPGGKYTATLFVRDCGATSPFATNVSLQTKWLGLIPSQRVIFTARNLPRIKLIWKNRRTLQIQCSECRRITPYGETLIFRQERSWQGARISYSFNSGEKSSEK